MTAELLVLVWFVFVWLVLVELRLRALRRMIAMQIRINELQVTVNQHGGRFMRDTIKWETSLLRRLGIEVEEEQERGPLQ